MTTLFTIIGIIGLITIIVIIYKNQPKNILISERTQIKASRAYDPLELAYICRYLKNLRKEIPEEEYDQIASRYANGTLRMLKDQLNCVLATEVGFLKTLEELNQFKLKYLFLYQEMDVLFPRRPFTSFREYKVYFPDFFLKEREQRLKQIKGVTDSMVDPFLIIEFMNKHISFSEENTLFPYSLDDKEEPIPMEIRKRVDDLLLEKAKEANDLKLFFRILTNMRDGKRIGQADKYFVDFLKKEKSRLEDWARYIEMIEKDRATIQKSSTLFSFCPELNRYIADEKSALRKSSQAI